MYTSSYVGQEGCHEEADDMEQSSSCSSPGEKLYELEEWSSSLVLTDDFSALDGEVGKRLNQMVPVPVSFRLLVYFFQSFLILGIRIYRRYTWKLSYTFMRDPLL